MKPRLGTCLIVFALALTGCSSAADSEPTRNGAGVPVYDGVPDPCALVSRSEVSQLVDRPAAHGRPTGTGHGCTFLAVGGGDAPLLASVFVETDDTPEAFAGDRDLMARQSEVALLDVANEAYTWTSNGAQGAEGRIGTIRLRVLLNGAEPAAAAELLRKTAPLL